MQNSNFKAGKDNSNINVRDIPKPQRKIVSMQKVIRESMLLECSVMYDCEYFKALNEKKRYIFFGDVITTQYQKN
jgi:hypothetical protein